MTTSLKAKNLLALFILTFSFSAFALTDVNPTNVTIDLTTDVIGTLPLAQNPNIGPHVPGNINRVPEVLISRNEYLLSFNRQTRLVNWASWKLEASDLGSSGRTNFFNFDPDLQNYLTQFNQKAVQYDEFRGSCYDRGHQVPSADRTTTEDVNKITFLMSNMLPQTAYLNRGMWARLESYARAIVKDGTKKVYIVSGPIYDEDFGMIGPAKDIKVPSKNFKVIIVVGRDQKLNDLTDVASQAQQVIAVIMPNIVKSDRPPQESLQELCGQSMNKVESISVVPTPRVFDDWKQYQVPLEQVERMSGFKIN